MPARQVVDAALAWLNTAPRPFLVYVHTIEAHRPYESALEHWRRFCRRGGMRIQRVVMIFLGTGIFGCGGGGGNPSQPSNPSDESRASFALAGAGRNETKSYAGAAGNLIFCRREDPFPNTIWVRLAEQRNADGEQGPHIDIDLCNFTGSGTYQAIHETSGARTCNQGQTFAIWWHEGSDVFVSKAAATACSVAVTRSTGAIDGTFQCHGLTPFAGGTSPALDVNAGSFHCAF